jgi:hypothetical protein
MNRKILAIQTLTIFVLMATGLAYAHWTKTFTIMGNVNTTELDWELKTPINCMDDNEGEKDYAADCDWNFWQGDKDVGGPTQLKLIDTDGDGDYDTLNVTLVNAYPGYAEEISFYVHNNGKVPLIFKKVIINGNEFYSGRPTVFLDLTGEGDYDIKIRFGDNLGEQFEPCEEPAEISVSILVLQDAPEGQTLTFTIKLVAENWSP